MAKYEATSPITLIAGETIADDLRGLIAIIDTSGRAVRPASSDNDALAIGAFAQDSMTTGEPVTVNQLIGKMQMISAAAIATADIGKAVVLTASANKRGKVDKIDDPASAAFVVGVALESAAADSPFQVLAVPLGPTA